MQHKDFKTQREPVSGSRFRDNTKVSSILRQLESRINFMENCGEKRTALILQNALLQAIEHNNYDYIFALDKISSQHGMIPVDIDQFIDDPFYLGGRFDIWPKLREDLREMKPDLMIGKQAKLEILNGSCIGTGKSVLGQISMLYDLYLLCCFKRPQELFEGITHYTPIIFVMQSVRDHISRRVLYQPFRQLFEDVPFNKRYVQWNKDKDSELILANNIQVVPMVASPLHYIGQAVIGAHIDEANFMEVVVESKKVSGAAGKGGLYDQAEEVYNNILRRRKSRFLTRGINPGTIYVSSSVNYKDDFMDRHMKDVDPVRDPHVVCLNYRQWDVKPFKFSETKFKFLVGTNDYPSKILDDKARPGLDYPASGMVELVPNDFKEDFRKDPDNAQRDILGISSSAIHRFISQTHKIVEAIVRGRENNMESFILKQNVILSEDGLPQVIESKLPPQKDRDTEHFVHIDLSRSSDKCGIAMSKVVGFMAVNTLEGVVEHLPVHAVIMAVTIEPDSVHQIDIAEIRQWVMLLATYYGFNIVQVTYDGFDSQESMQVWRKAGISSFKLSMDISTEPYEYTKSALYQDRILMVDNPLIKDELATLEKHEKGGKSKIDHPPKGSKDGADAVAGSVKSAAMYRRIRAKVQVTDEQGEKVQVQRKTTQRRPAQRR